MFETTFTTKVEISRHERWAPAGRYYVAYEAPNGTRCAYLAVVDDFGNLVTVEA